MHCSGHAHKYERPGGRGQAINSDGRICSIVSQNAPDLGGLVGVQINGRALVEDQQESGCSFVCECYKGNRGEQKDTRGGAL